MADTGPDASAQLQTSVTCAPPTASPCTTAAAQSCTSVPANVVAAIKKSSDMGLEPALFALPCESLTPDIRFDCFGSSHTKKLKLCKRVGWLRDGVLTTGYMEVNIKEAKQKGIFNRPRRVTLVRKEDSGFQSTEVSTGAHPPTGSQLSAVMLKRNTAATALVDIKGEFIPSTILVDKASLLMDEETSGKLVALSSRGPGSAALPSEKQTGNSQKAAAAAPDGSCPRDPSRQDPDSNNTAVPLSGPDTYGYLEVSRSNPGAPVKSPSGDSDHFTAIKYFLTEGGEASLANGKLAWESDHDYLATPAVQTLQHLIQVADANRKGSYSGSGDSAALRVQQLHATHQPAHIRQLAAASVKMRSKASLPPLRPTTQEAQLAKRPSLVDVMISKGLMSDDPKELATAKVHKGSHQLQRPDKRARGPIAKTVSAMHLEAPSSVDGKRSHPNVLARDATHIDHSYVSVPENNNTGGKALVYAEHSYSSSANPREAFLNADGVPISHTPENQTPIQDPGKINPQSNHPVKCSFAPVGAASPTSTVSETPLTSTSSDTKSAIVGRESSDVPKSDSPSDDISDGMPTLRIGSVYSLSEQEARDLFPDTKLAKSAGTTQAPDRENPVESTSKLKIQNEPIHTSQTQGVQSSGNLARPHSNAHTIPFSNSSNVTLFNITPVRSSQGKRAICTPVTAVAPDPPGHVPQSKSAVSVPSPMGHTILQQPASQVYTLISSNSAATRPDPSRRSLVPVQVGTLQGTAVSAPVLLPVFTRSAGQGTPTTPTLVPGPLGTVAAPAPLISQTPATLRLPACGKIVLTGVSKDASRSQTAPGDRIAEVTPVLSTILPQTSVTSVAAGSSHAVVSPPATATGPHTLVSPAGSVTRETSTVIREVSTAPVTGAEDMPSTEQSTPGTGPSLAKQPATEPVARAPRKTFLITTSNGEKRLVCLSSHAYAASMLSQMAGHKAFQFVVPQGAADRRTGIKGDCREERQKSEDVPSARSHKDSKKSHNRLSTISRHKTKKRVPILKIKFRTESKVEPKREPEVNPTEHPQAEVDVRRSTRDKKRKRPYSPPMEVSRRPKVCHSDNQEVTSGEITESTSATDTGGSKMPFIKTEPGTPDQAPWRPDCSSPDDGDSLPPRPSPPSPTYVDRESRVRRLKQIMKEKEDALEEILSQRKRELEERLADPELCDL